MTLLDYVPAILAFAFALLAVVGKTRDDAKHGLQKITRVGWTVLSLSAISLLLGLYTIYSKHVALDKRAVVADLARERLVQGIALMLKPLCGADELYAELAAARLFEIMRTDANLTSVGNRRAVKWPGMGGGVVASSDSLPYRTFNEVYQLLDFYISEGERMTKEGLVSFGGYLSEDEIIAISRLISDTFLNGEYRLSGKVDYFEKSLEDERRSGDPSPWNTVGLHYFNAIYDGTSARPGSVQPALDFLQKAEAAVSLILNRRQQATRFVPCSR